MGPLHFKTYYLKLLVTPVFCGLLEGEWFIPTIINVYYTEWIKLAGASADHKYRERTINSIVLLSNGLSFCIQVMAFLVLGSFADFGTWRPNILIVITVIGIAIGFSWLGVHTSDQWQSAAALYIIGLVAYSVGYAFWIAAFVGLSRSHPALRQKAEDLKIGDITRDEYDKADGITRSRYLNIATYVVAPFQVVFTAVCVGILYALNVKASVANSNWGISVVIAFLSGVCILFSLPWFILEKRRPGQTVPAGYFLLTDSFFTTITVIMTLQNEVLEYNLITLNYLAMVGWAAQFVSVFLYWTIQQKFQIRNKTMYCWIAFCIILLDVWGMIGIWTQKIGFHHQWEFWLFETWWGLVSAYYSYSQIMISEVTPRGKEFLFFSFFNIFGTTTSFVGPVISSAIIDVSSSHNSSLPFYFLTAVALTSTLLVFFFVSPEKSQVEQAVFLEDERVDRERRAAALISG
ncbi:hypothetical protein MMC07_009658 [Pseudocyphellaria aurata]|nr:hypothetical protein [Pseudocyphellaria aurata]